MEFLSNEIYGNSILKWIISFVIAIISIGLSRVIYLFIKNVLKKRAEKSEGKLDDIIIESLEKPVVFGIMIAGIWYSSLQLELPQRLTHIGSKIYYVLIIFLLTWFIFVE